MTRHRNLARKELRYRWDNHHVAFRNLMVKVPGDHQGRYHKYRKELKKHPLWLFTDWHYETEEMRYI